MALKEAIKMGKVLNMIEKKGFDYDMYPGIAEQGYDDKPLICANWNPPLMGRVYNWIEKNHGEEYELDWSDEWMRCADCGKAIRSIHNSYGWEPCYMSGDCEVLCIECCKDEDTFREMLEFYINHDNRAIASWAIELAEKEGFKCFESEDSCNQYETGFHVHQNDSPRDLAKYLRENLTGHDFLFAINCVGQFDVKWMVLVRKKEVS